VSSPEVTEVTEVTTSAGDPCTPEREGVRVSLPGTVRRPHALRRNPWATSVTSYFQGSAVLWTCLLSDF
jgi:hypothetical protein